MNLITTDLLQEARRFWDDLHPRRMKCANSCTHLISRTSNKHSEDVGSQKGGINFELLGGIYFVANDGRLYNTCNILVLLDSL